MSSIKHCLKKKILHKACLLFFEIKALLVSQQGLCFRLLDFIHELDMNKNLLFFFSFCATVGHKLVPLKVLLNQSSQHPGSTKHRYWTRSVDQQQLEQTLDLGWSGWHLWQYHQNENKNHITTRFLSHPYCSHSICLVRRGFKRWSLQ